MKIPKISKNKNINIYEWFKKRRLGCRKMQKIKNNIFKNIKSLHIFVFIFLIIFTICLGNFSLANSYYYKPPSPSGPSYGEINTEYKFIMYSQESDGYWKFYWGDNTYSDWIKESVTSNYITINHSWENPGLYHVSVIRKNKYMENSSWSNPLIINITTEGTNSQNNIDKKNLDSDSDGLFDYIEDFLGSDSNNKFDVESLNINGELYFIVDTNYDEQIDTFYNKLTNKTTNIEIMDKGLYLIKMDEEGSWDYVYNPFDGSISPYDSNIKSTSEFPWLTAIVTITIAVIIILLILFKTGVLFIYEEEYEEE